MSSFTLPFRKTDTIGHRKLKNQLGKVFEQTVGRGRAAAITNRNRVDAYLVPPEAFEEMQRATEEVERLKETISLLLIAVSAGVAIPSQTLKALDIELPFTWQELNAFQARFPIKITHSEEGLPLAPAPELTHQMVEESDEELIFEP
jgi:PHD/YefM family antitoxin component YafN of YafNO toxin-antitoxin module